MFCVIALDIHNTMRPFNPDRANTVRNPVHLSRLPELALFGEETHSLTHGQTFMQPHNKMVAHARAEKEKEEGGS